MQAAVMYERHKPLVVDDVDLAEPGSNEVEVELVASGVCQSDLHHLERETPLSPPAVLGHEGAGVVKSVGPNVTRVKPGDHVIIALGPQCGECFYCVRGMPYLCTPAQPPRTHLSKDGQPIVQMVQAATYAERTVVSQNNVVKIREDAPLDVVCIVGCSVATGVGAVMHVAAIEPGSNVVVIGTGGVGLNVIQGARLAGAERIIAVDLLDNKLEFAQEMGATHLINGGREDAIERVKALTGGRGADYAFEVIGLPKTIAQAYDSVRKGGTAVIVGVADAKAEMPFKPFSMQMSARKLIGCNMGAYRPQVDLPLLVDLYMDGRIKLNELITRRFSLNEVNQALHALAAGEVARAILEIH
jgi:S-(hydroxymethyl)glutathione dehydrogenase / alcohol dehydrogenase